MHKVWQLTEVANESEPSFLCQDKTSFVKMKLPATRKSAISVNGG
jgi:hypothetical protein